MRDDELQHAWDVTPPEAIAIQQRLRGLVIKEDAFGPVAFVAGVDIGFEDGGATTRAAVAVLRFPELTLHEHAISRRPTAFPYVPGLLSFREAPAILAAYAGLRETPDLLIFDGQGIAHRRRFGIASHVGLWLDMPSIGSAKSILVGTHGPLGEEAGSTAEMVDSGEVVGLAVRTKRRVKPVYVSIGHRVDLPTAAEFVLRCCRGYRLPEPQRQAHLAASSR